MVRGIFAAGGFNNFFQVRAGAPVVNWRDHNHAARGSDFFVQECERFSLENPVVVKVGQRVVFVFNSLEIENIAQIFGHPACESIAFAVRVKADRK